jgi:hypothetical protein
MISISWIMWQNLELQCEDIPDDCGCQYYYVIKEID